MVKVEQKPPATAAQPFNGQCFVVVGGLLWSMLVCKCSQHLRPGRSSHRPKRLPCATGGSGRRGVGTEPGARSARGTAGAHGRGPSRLMLLEGNNPGLPTAFGSRRPDHREPREGTGWRWGRRCCVACAPPLSFSFRSFRPLPSVQFRFPFGRRVPPACLAGQ